MKIKKILKLLDNKCPICNTKLSKVMSKNFIAFICGSRNYYIRSRRASNGEGLTHFQISGAEDFKMSLEDNAEIVYIFKNFDLEVVFNLDNTVELVIVKENEELLNLNISLINYIDKWQMPYNKLENKIEKSLLLK